jgi:hypothetical protein
MASVSINSIGRRVACRLLLLLGVALAVQPIKPSWADTIPEVRRVRFGLHAGRTRIVIDVDQEVAFSVEAPGDSTRLVVALPEMTWRVEDGSPSPRPGLASGYDHGSDGPGRARVTVDMRGPVRLAQQLTGFDPP